MLKTEGVVKLLKSKKNGASFNDVWKGVKESTISSITKKDIDENSLKADLYLSMIEDNRLIMTGDNTWNLKKRYSISDQKSIEKTRLTEEVAIVFDEELEDLEDSKEEKIDIIEEEEEK